MLKHGEEWRQATATYPVGGSRVGFGAVPLGFPKDAPRCSAGSFTQRALPAINRASGAGRRVCGLLKALSDVEGKRP